MNFLNELWESIHDTYQSIIQHPFNKELENGTLEQDKFQFYVSQDIVYIGEYSRALAVLASKAPDHEGVREFINFAKEGLDIERELHEELSKTFRVKKASEIALSTESYASFLLSTTAFKDFTEGVSALLPCFWVYNQVAINIYKNSKEDNPYNPWIQTYSGAEFDETTKRMKEIVSELSEEASEKEKRKMKESFIRSTKYEWYFWDSAYYKRFWR
jgi:thiaminase/transcriptional activator TenA